MGGVGTATVGEAVQEAMDKGAEKADDMAEALAETAEKAKQTIRETMVCVVRQPSIQSSRGGSDGVCCATAFDSVK
jgi:hypothetical protein